MTKTKDVIAHAKRQSKKGKNPSICYKGERNPKKALILAIKDIEVADRKPRGRSMLNDPLNRYWGIGSGHYCPDCGGLCGNDKHTRRW